MRVAIPVHGERISSLFDAARRFKVLSLSRSRELVRSEFHTESDDPIEKAKEIVALGTEVLICGAISWPVELVLVSGGVRVIPNTCGLAEEVIAAFVAGNLTDEAFLMPGCRGRRQRRRHRHRGGRNRANR